MATQYSGGSNPSRDPNNRELNRPARGGAPWIWLIVAIIIAFIVWFFVASGNNARHGTTAADARNGSQTTTADNAANTPTPDATMTAAAITSPADIVKASDQQSLVGKTVRLQDVKVQKVGSNGNFWVTDDSQNKLLVVRENTASPATTDSSSATSGMASNSNTTTQTGTNPMNSNDTSAAHDNTAASRSKADSTGIGTISPSNSSQHDANSTASSQQNASSTPTASPTEPVVMGQTVTVAGVVQQLPTDKTAQKQMGLKSSDTRGQQVYIAANQVNVQH